MKKLFYILLVGALTASCTETYEDEEVKQIIYGQPVAVSFGTYVTQSAATRSEDDYTRLPIVGATGSIVNVERLRQVGFGVFGYYSDGNGSTDGSYSANPTAPNFMYDQSVTWTGDPYSSEGSWTYSPVKYWPNETTTDRHGATSAHTDVLSFFAYAPYVGHADAEVGTDNQLTPTDHINTHRGVVKLSDNFTPGDPKIDYIPSSISTNSVDLLWAVAPEGGFTYKPVNGTAEVTIPAGFPLKDLVKPTTDQKITFQFKHALARMGMTIKMGDVMVAGAASSADKDAMQRNTIITIDEVKITGNVPQQATLNLNNTVANKPLWTDAVFEAAGNRHTYIIDDRSLTQSLRSIGSVWKDAGDHSQGYSDEFKYLAKGDWANGSNGLVTASSAKTVLKSAKSVRDTEVRDAAAGTYTEQEVNDNVLNARDAGGKIINEQTYLMVIPLADDGAHDTDLEVEITYTIITIDPTMPEGYSRLTNTAKGTATIAGGMQAGYTYMLNSTLEMDAVLLKVDREAWKDPIVFAPPVVEPWKEAPEEQMDFQSSTKTLFHGSGFTGQLPLANCTDAERAKLHQKVLDIYQNLADDQTSVLRFKAKTGSSGDHWKFNLRYLSAGGGETNLCDELCGGTNGGYYDWTPGEEIYIYIPVGKGQFETYAVGVRGDGESYWEFEKKSFLMQADLQNITIENIQFLTTSDVCGTGTGREVKILKADNETEIKKH